MRARKRFGQHFLEPAWADKLVAAIEPQPGDRFLEIGPGPGALTLRLAPRVAHLTAVEIDRDLAADLAPRLPANADLVVADFLQMDLGPLAASGPLRVAGNLPYNISSPILFRLIDAAKEHLVASAFTRKRKAGGSLPAEAGSHETGFFSDSSDPGRLVDATLMLQREVADRLEAEPGTGDYGVLSISVQLHAGVHRLLTLPPGAFRPRPRVHSAVVRLTFRPPDRPPRDERVFEAMVRSAFTQRRKTLANALASFADARGMRAGQALEASGIDPSRRPETLNLAELTRLSDTFAAGPGT
jgi:16S rRNA (adenine1518-N6/adenine1519-N6)-dimethyltransferase